MTAAHRAQPVVAKNRTTAQAILRTVRARRTVKRVVLVAHDFPPKRGGMETVAHDLAVGLHRAGVRVRVYTSKRLGAPLPDLPRHAVRSLFASGPAGVPIDLWGDLLLTLDALLVDRPDVVHLCHAGLAPWVPALRAALPIAVTVHVHGNDLVAPWVHHGGDADAYGRAQIQGLAQSDAVFAVSDFSAGLARDRQVPAARIAVVENGVDTERFSPRPFDRDLADRHGIAADDELVLCVSRLAPRKGHSVALTAMAEVMKQRPRALFAFTGDHPRMLADLLGLADELGIRDRVRALGAVTNDDLPGLYALARVVVLLSDQVNKDDVEGFGVTLLEAAASGVATVASRSGGMPEAVDDGVTGLLVDAGDPLSAAQAITTLLADPDRTRRMGAAGRARVLARFDSNARTERMLDHWRSIATSKPRGPRGSLEEFRQAFAGPAPEAGSVRDQLAHAAHGVALVRLAQIHAAHQRKQAHERRASFARIVQNGGTVRLRANTAGARWLPDALADCAALKHQPALDTRLRRFLEPDFLACAVPQLSAVHLSHSVPAPGHDVLLARVRALPATALAKIAGFRMFLSDEARGSDEIARSAVPQTQALRRTLAAHGVTAVPPPELMRYLSETPAGGPSTAMIEPTNFCNLACPTCPAGTGKIKPAPPMPVDHYDKALAALAGPLKTLALWNYGEPLLHPDLATLIARAKAARVATVKISTNAHFLEAHRAQALLHAGLDVLIVSVDGASADSYATFRKDGSFEQVAHNIAHFCAEKKRLGQLRPRVELQFIVMRHNEHELPEIRRLAAVWGVDRLRIKTVGAEDETRALVPTAALLSRYRGDARTPNTRHAFCAMAWDHTVINVDGSVTPCCYLRPDMGDAFVMGNVFSTPFPAIWRGQRYRAFRAAMLAGREHMPVCNRCRGGTHDLFVANEEVAAP